MAENKREGIRAQLRDLIMGQLQERGHTEDTELLEYIDQAVFHMGQQVYLPLKERLWLRNSLYDSFRRLDILQELLDDKSVTEIMINGAGKIFIEQSGNVRLWERRFEKPEQLEDIIQQVVSRVNRVVNVSSPIVDARLEDGSRVHVVLPPVALDGPAVTIRKFPEPITMEKLVGLGALTEEAADCLKVLVEEKRNLFISGGTNSGKTTFLNALSAFIPPQERVITIEDSAELQITQVPNLVRLETRNANTEGEGEITMSQLIRASLRMNPSQMHNKNVSYVFIYVKFFKGGQLMGLLNELYEKIYADLPKYNLEYELLARDLKPILAELEGREDFDRLSELFLLASSCSQKFGWITGFKDGIALMIECTNTLD